MSGALVKIYKDQGETVFDTFESRSIPKDESNRFYRLALEEIADGRAILEPPDPAPVEDRLDRVALRSLIDKLIEKGVVTRVELEDTVDRAR